MSNNDDTGQPMLPPETPLVGLGRIVGDFWSWAYSDVMNNRNRSILAEYLVGFALDAVSSPRIDWDNFDLTYRDVEIEVKSAAYLQSWHQIKPSIIRFDIKPSL